MKKETLKVLQGVEVKKHYKTEEYQIGHVLEDIAMLKNPKRVLVVERSWHELDKNQRNFLKGALEYGEVLKYGKLEVEFLKERRLYSWLKKLLGKENAKSLKQRLHNWDTWDDNGEIARTLSAQREFRLSTFDRIYVARNYESCEPTGSKPPELELIAVFGEEKVRSLFSDRNCIIEKEGIRIVVNVGRFYQSSIEYSSEHLGNLSLMNRLKATDDRILAVPKNTVLYY